jgi:hypothetical protein
MTLDPQCWVIGHLQLTDEEAERYKGIPVVYHETYVSLAALAWQQRERTMADGARVPGLLL